MRANINLHNMDCMEAMKKMGDNQFDLAIVDPPYGIGDFNQPGGVAISSKQKHAKITWNEAIPTREYFKELYRVADKHIIFGCQYYSKYLRDEDCGRIIHDKQVSMATLSQADMASCNMQRRVSVFKYLWNGMLQENMKNKERKIHPCQKPVALYKWLLQNYAKEGDKILDTHLGSGSIAIACWDLGYDLEAYEIDKEYYKNGVDRFNNHCKQGQLF